MSVRCPAFNFENVENVIITILSPNTNSMSARNSTKAITESFIELFHLHITPLISVFMSNPIAHLKMRENLSSAVFAPTLSQDIGKKIPLSINSCPLTFLLLMLKF